MNFKRQASKNETSSKGNKVSNQNRRKQEKWQKDLRRKAIKIRRFQLISSYVIWLKNICLQVRALPVREGFLKSFTAPCYIKYLAFASHLLLPAIRKSGVRNGEV